MSIKSVFVAMAFALLAAGVAADAGAQRRREGPCAADARKFCGDVRPGQGAIAKCMRAHQADLSPACQDEVKARAAQAERVRNECKGDAERLCKGVTPGGGRILSCLKSKQADLSPACAEDLKSRGDRRRRPQ